MSLDEKKENFLVMFETLSNEYFIKFEQNLMSLVSEEFNDCFTGFGEEEFYEMLRKNHFLKLYHGTEWIRAKFGEE